MPKHQLVRVDDFVAYEDDWDGKPITASDVSLEELVDFLDGNAEGRNNHDYVNAHRSLGCILFAKLGREQATVVMFEIAEWLGLDGMHGVGMGGKGEEIWRERGIPEYGYCPRKEWCYDDMK